MTTETNDGARPLLPSNLTEGTSAPAPRPAPSPALSDIFALWHVQGRIEVIPLSTVAADVAAGRLSPLVEET